MLGNDPEWLPKNGYDGLQWLELMVDGGFIGYWWFMNKHIV